MRALALLALLLGGVLAPTAVAQTVAPGTVTVEFDRDHKGYHEGDPVTILTSGATNGMRTIVSCDSCPDKDTSYEAATRQSMVFPDDFPGARNDRQPKWNGTWTVQVRLGASLVAQNTFHVTLVNVWEYENHEPHASTMLKFQSAGLTPGAPYQFHVRHRTGDGTFETRFLVDVPARPDGIAATIWLVDEDETERFRCPGLPKGYCQQYELVVKGPGKPDETQKFRMVPAKAQILIREGGTIANAPATFERTMNVSAVLDVKYPFGYRVTKDHLTRAANPNGTMAVTIERRSGEGTDERREDLDRTVAVFDAPSNLWIVRWTIPRDEQIRVDYRFSLVVDEQKDRHGNTVPRTPIVNFTIVPARLSPVILDQPTDVERLDLAKVVLALRYHDGSPLQPKEYASVMRGCFVKDDPGVSNCRNGFIAKTTFWKNGTWNFTYRFPVDYPDLSEHQFLFEGGDANGGGLAGSNVSSGRDQYGNVFENRLSRPFKVVPASPRIDLTTTVAGEERNETRGWDRGDVVAVTAHISYPDGKPFNATVNHLGKDRLPVVVTKHGKEGAPAGEFQLNLTNVDENAGRWTGTIRLSREAAEAPVGNWSMRFRVRDNITPANSNDTTFLRPVHMAEIDVTPTNEPPRRVPTGTVVPWRFRLVYSDGTSVTPNDLGTRFWITVVRVNQLSFTGAAVSGQLFPSYDPGRDEWAVDWKVPPVLFQGTFAFKPVGQDRHGNFVDSAARSRAFETFTDAHSRAVITEPVTRVERGGTVMAVFDGRDGDLHFQPRNRSHMPVVEVQRFDADAQDWVVEDLDARVPGEGAGDHVARFETSIETALGLYRFQLRGRDVNFNLVNGTSEPFTVMPTNVTRALFLPPPERVAKGQPITWSVEREGGDLVSDVRVFYNGRDVREGGTNMVGGVNVLSGPIFTTGEDRFNFSWRVPFSSDTGEYKFTVRGRDAFGNRVEVEVPPVRAEPSVLTGRVLGSPERVVERGSAVTVLFAVSYPNGDPFFAQGSPRVLVMNDTGLVDQAQVVNAGLSFESRWTPPLDAPLVDYWFEVTGTDRGGNVFPALRSERFRLAPGAFEREFQVQPKLGYQRMQPVVGEVLAESTDTFVAFTLAYVGEPGILSQALVGSVDATTIANLEHEVDPATGRYVVEWATERDTKVGVYRLEFTGQDGFGNEFRGRSEPFTIRSTVLLPTFTNTIQSDEFEPGNVIEFAFVVTYPPPANARLDDAIAQPDARILWDGNPVLQRPEVSYDAARGEWVAKWEVPPDLPPGTYQLIVAGTDDSNNQISPGGSQQLKYDGPPAVTGLLKLVPGPGVPLVVALAAVAAAIAGRRRRD